MKTEEKLIKAFLLITAIGWIYFSIQRPFMGAVTIVPMLAGLLITYLKIGSHEETK